MKGRNNNTGRMIGAVFLALVSIVLIVSLSNLGGTITPPTPDNGNDNGDWPENGITYPDPNGGNDYPPPLNHFANVEFFPSHYPHYVMPNFVQEYRLGINTDGEYMHIYNLSWDILPAQIDPDGGDDYMRWGDWTEPARIVTNNINFSSIDYEMMVISGKPIKYGERPYHPLPVEPTLENSTFTKYELTEDGISNNQYVKKYEFKGFSHPGGAYMTLDVPPPQTGSGITHFYCNAITIVFVEKAGV